MAKDPLGFLTLWAAGSGASLLIPDLSPVIGIGLLILAVPLAVLWIRRDGREWRQKLAQLVEPSQPMGITQAPSAAFRALGSGSLESEHRSIGGSPPSNAELRFRPFDSGDPQFVHETFYTGDRTNLVMFVAVRPVSTGEPVGGCRGYLNAVWLLGDNSQWEPTAFTDVRPLNWGGTNAEAVKIDADTNQVLNVFVVEKGSGGGPLEPCIRPEARLNKHEGALDDPWGVYRFDIFVEGANGAKAKTSLMFSRMGDEWNDFRVSEIEPW